MKVLVRVGRETYWVAVKDMQLYMYRPVIRGHFDAIPSYTPVSFQ